MQGFDLRVYKRSLRDHMKKLRSGMSTQEKADKDERIRKRVLGMRQYREADTLLCYVSLPCEVDTIGLIQDAWAHGKRVAVPKCREGRSMTFHLIYSLDDLQKGTFGVLEPMDERCPEITDFGRAICIVPALSYDFGGYRLGYGGGYYDRFLSRYSIPKIGIVYSQCVRPRLPRGRFDIPVDVIVTDQYFRVTGGKTAHPAKKR